MPAGTMIGKEARLAQGLRVGFCGSIVLTAICATLAFVGIGSAAAQSSELPPAGLRTDRLDRPDALSAPPDANAQMLSRRRKMRLQDFDRVNAARRQQIDDASGKLLFLAVDLRSRLVQSRNEPVPSIVIREVEIIERLAREVQQKMALTVGTE